MIRPGTANLRLQELLVCILFYTRLPVGRWSDQEVDFAAAQWAAPLVGLLIGSVGSLVYFLAASSGVATTVAAALCLGSMILATGALHEDGAADTADGFGGGNTPEQKLDIMRDSRLGTYGALALALSVIIRWASIAALADPATVMVALLSAHAASRALIPLFMIRVKPARSDGLSANAGIVNTSTATVALTIAALALILAGIPFAAISTVCLLLWVITIQSLCKRQIGGQTGDVIGALQQGSEIVVLVVATAALT